MKSGLLGGAFALLLALPAAAQMAVSGNDNKVRLVNGAIQVVPNPPPDTVTVLDLSASPPRVVAEVQAPHSVVGPPFSVALTPDARLALVSSNQRIDPQNPQRTAPDNRLSVIDLRANPPAVSQTLETGLGPAGLSVTPDGRMALVANREEGTVSVFRIAEGRLEPAGKVEVANRAANVAHAAVTPDGRHALVPRDGDSVISVLRIADGQVSRTDRTISAGLRPYGLAVAPNGRFAAVANIGRGGGDLDTVSLIDLSGEPATWRVVETITVGQTPEGIQVSPDSRHVAVTVMNGSNKPENSPFRGQGLVRLLRVEDNMRLVPMGEAPVGTWSQGAAFSADGRTLLVQNMVEREIQVLRVEDGRPTDTGTRIPVGGGPAAIRALDSAR